MDLNLQTYRRHNDTNQIYSMYLIGVFDRLRNYILSNTNYIVS